MAAPAPGRQLSTLPPNEPGGMLLIRPDLGRRHSHHAEVGPDRQPHRPAEGLAAAGSGGVMTPGTS
jgi:hypothetical protein